LEDAYSIHSLSNGAAILVLTSHGEFIRIADGRQGGCIFPDR
jgi:hypothetical protein